MPIEKIAIDSYDGEPLKSVDPVSLTFDGLQYELYLSEDNLERLRDTLEPFLVNERDSAIRIGSAKSDGGKNWLSVHVIDRDALVDWFEQNAKLFSPDTKFGRRGRVQKQFKDEIEALAKDGKVPADLYK